MSQQDRRQASASRTRTYRGGCLCGAVRFRAEIDWSQATVAGHHASVWESAVCPRGFTLLVGDESLHGYELASRSAHDFYCEHCGTRVFSRHHAAQPQGEHYSIDVKCLEVQIERACTGHGKRSAHGTSAPCAQ